MRNSKSMSQNCSRRREEADLLQADGVFQTRSKRTPFPNLCRNLNRNFCRSSAPTVTATFLLALCAFPAHAQPFHLPTANLALFEKGGEEKFFVGTTGKNWITGTFGCVRSEGWQMHEGLDIRCLKRDKHGEPSDPILA